MNTRRLKKQILMTYMDIYKNNAVLFILYKDIFNFCSFVSSIHKCPGLSNSLDFTRNHTNGSRNKKANTQNITAVEILYRAMAGAPPPSTRSNFSKWRRAFLILMSVAADTAKINNKGNKYM